MRAHGTLRRGTQYLTSRPGLGVCFDTMTSPDTKKRRCPACGVDITGRPSACPNCGKKLSRTAKIECPSCGERIPKGSKECPICKADLSGMPTKAESKSATKIAVPPTADRKETESAEAKKKDKGASCPKCAFTLLGTESSWRRGGHGLKFWSA